MVALQIESIDDGNSNFQKVELRDSGNTGTDTPHCSEHGAMNKITSWDEREGIWRCQDITERGEKHLEIEDTCRAGCIERRGECGEA